MSVSEEYLDKAKAEIKKLEQAGVVLCGNAFSQVLFIKGEPEQDGTTLLSGQDGTALQAAINALGYSPQDWAGMSTLDSNGFALVPGTLRLAITTLDPSTIIALDDTAAAALREAFVEELADLTNLYEATLQPGYVSHILGMRVLALGGFAASLSDPAQKQVMWDRLQLLPPLAEPY